MQDDYVPASSLAWLDVDATASERVATLLKALEEPGTFDPLGFGTIRDFFSDVLSPGTSTIHSRLRYFLFVPWICERLEAEGLGPAQFRSRLREDEARLISCLRHLGRNAGVQGYDSGEKLKRMPSEAYWSGLFIWGIRQFDISIAEYAKRSAAFSRSITARDDDGMATQAVTSMWFQKLPPVPDGFLQKDITFDLTATEADFLTGRIKATHPDSLLSVACSYPNEAADAELPWGIPEQLLTADLSEIVHHARCASELTWGPQIVYNLELAQQAHRDLGWDKTKLIDQLEQQLEDWSSLVAARSSTLEKWVDDIGSFWSILDAQSVVKEPTREFTQSMVRKAIEDPTAFATDPVVRHEICQREAQLKGKRARLMERSALEQWNGEPFGGRLVYRWPTCRSYVQDIAQAQAVV